MAISESGLNYDNDGFLVGIKSIDNTAGSVNNDLKEILKIIRGRKNFEPPVIDLGNVETRTNKIKNAVSGLNRLNHGVNTSPVTPVQTVTNENNTKVIVLSSDIQSDSTPALDQAQPTAKTKDSNQILLDHQVTGIVKNLQGVSESVKEQPDRQKKQIDDVRKSLDPIRDMAENTVKPLNGIDKMQKRSEPLSREQKEYNNDEEQALGQLSQQTGKSLSLKQIVGAVPLIAVALSGALIVAIKKWWDNKDGSKTEAEPQKQPDTPQTQDSKPSDTNTPKQADQSPKSANNAEQQAKTDADKTAQPTTATDSPKNEAPGTPIATGSSNPTATAQESVPTTANATNANPDTPKPLDTPQIPERVIPTAKNGQTNNLGGGYRREQDLSFREPPKSKFRQAVDSVKGIVSTTLDKVRGNDNPSTGDVSYVDPKTGTLINPLQKVDTPQVEPNKATPDGFFTKAKNAISSTLAGFNTPKPLENNEPLPVLEREVHTPKNGQTTNLGGGVRRVQDNRFIKYQTPLEKIADSASKIYHKIRGDDDNVVNPLLTNDVLGDNASGIVSNAVSNGAMDVVSGKEPNSLFSMTNASPIPSVGTSNASNSFTSTDKIEPVSKTTESTGSSKPQQISIQNSSEMNMEQQPDRLLLHSISENISNAVR